MTLEIRPQGFALISLTPVSWHVVAESLPDSDITVLLFDKDASEPVWFGYYTGEDWRYIDGMPAYPTYWADIPEGPSL